MNKCCVALINYQDADSVRVSINAASVFSAFDIDVSLAVFMPEWASNELEECLEEVSFMERLNQAHDLSTFEIIIVSNKEISLQEYIEKNTSQAMSAFSFLGYNEWKKTEAFKQQTFTF